MTESDKDEIVNSTLEKMNSTGIYVLSDAIITVSGTKLSITTNNT